MVGFDREKACSLALSRFFYVCRGCGTKLRSPNSPYRERQTAINAAAYMPIVLKFFFMEVFTSIWTFVWWVKRRKAANVTAFPNPLDRKKLTKVSGS
jgi:hypothetical protein